LKAASSDVDVEVPSCPGWNLARLVEHVGGVWGWAADIVRSGEQAEFHQAPEGLGAGDLIEWASGQRRNALDALAVADPDSNCWTFGLPRSRLFWFRRQALEAAVHAWDAHSSLAVPEPIEPQLASDGIDEFLSVMLPRLVKRRPGDWTGQSLHLSRTDGTGHWNVRLGPGPEISTDHEEARSDSDVTLEAPASTLYLWCLNRAKSDELDVSGDNSVAQRWAAEVAF